MHLAPPAFFADLVRLASAMEAPAPNLALIGRRSLRSNNSWMHGIARLMRGPDRCTLLMNAVDAEALGLTDGDAVSIESETGTARAPVEITPEVMPGVVSLPHGFEHARYNDLTSSHLLDDLTGNAALSGVPVIVRALKRDEIALGERALR